MKDVRKDFFGIHAHRTEVGLHLSQQKSFHDLFIDVESSQCKLNSVMEPISIVVAAFIQNRTSYPVRLARSKPTRRVKRV